MYIDAMTTKRGGVESGKRQTRKRRAKRSVERRTSTLNWIHQKTNPFCVESNRVGILLDLSLLWLLSSIQVLQWFLIQKSPCSPTSILRNKSSSSSSSSHSTPLQLLLTPLPLKKRLRCNDPVEIRKDYFSWRSPLLMRIWWFLWLFKPSNNTWLIATVWIYGSVIPPCHASQAIVNFRLRRLHHRYVSLSSSDSIFSSSSSVSLPSLPHTVVTKWYWCR